MPEDENIKITTDPTSSEREFALKERELALKEKEVEAKIKHDNKGLWFTSPLILGVITAFSGLIVTGIGAFLQSNANLNLERNKFEYTLIQKALETPSQDLRVKNLKFLVDIGVIQSLKGDKLKDIAEKDPQSLPTYNTVAALTPEVTNGVISEKVRELDRQILFILQRDYPNSLVTFSDNTNVELNHSTLPLLQPAAKLALEKAIKNRGKKLTVNAAYRSIISQHIIYSYYKQGIGGIALAATPGKSNHQTGLAIDIGDAEGWKSYLEAEGWSWMGKSDPVHFSFSGSESLDIGTLSIKSFQQLWNLNHPQDKLTENGLYDSETASRIKQAPPNGFPKGEKCSTKCGFKSP